MIYGIPMASVFHVGARVSKEQKERYKSVAQGLNVSLSDLIVASLEGISNELSEAQWSCGAVTMEDNKIRKSKSHEKGILVVAPAYFWETLSSMTP